MRTQQLSSKERQRRAHVLSTGFDLDTNDYGAMAERSVYTVSVSGQRSCGCSCDCGWASGEDQDADRSRGRGSHRKRRSRSLSASGSGSGSGTSGVGPVASATLGSGSHRGSRRTRGDEEAGLPREHEDDIDEGDEKTEAPDVRVQIEETVTVEVEYDPEVYARESYRTPRVLWEVHSGGGGNSSRGETRSWRSARSVRAGDAGPP